MTVVAIQFGTLFGSFAASFGFKGILLGILDLGTGIDYLLALAKNAGRLTTVELKLSSVLMSKDQLQFQQDRKRLLF